MRTGTRLRPDDSPARVLAADRLPVAADSPWAAERLRQEARDFDSLTGPYRQS